MKQLKVLTTVYSVVIVILSIVLIVQGIHKDDYYNELYESLINASRSSNWTNCSTFLADSSAINITSIVDTDWVIFYFWTFDEEDSYTLRFSVPSDLLVQRVRESLHYEPKPLVNWSQAELFLDTSVDISCLLIRTDTPGMYRFIPTMDMEAQITTENYFALKQVDGYLAIVNCFGKMAYALAPVYKMPKNSEIPALVEKLNFWNPLGRSYLDPKNTTIPFDQNVPTELDDDEEDQALQIEKTKKRVEIRGF